jgi:T3SS negative regulator,GrlR
MPRQREHVADVGYARKYHQPMSPRNLLTEVPNMKNGLWAVEFFTNTGITGSGVVALENGRILGGDHSYYYFGSYTIVASLAIDQEILRGEVQIRHYHGERSNVFGPVDELNLRLECAVGSPWIMGHGYEPSVPDRRLSLRLRLLEELP